MTARELIALLVQKKLCNVICNNGFGLSIWVDNFSYSHLKGHESNQRFSQIHVQIDKQLKTIPFMENYSIGDNQYILPERFLNQLLSSNEGIDEYRTFEKALGEHTLPKIRFEN